MILYGTYAKGQLLAPKKVQNAIVSLIKASWGLGSKALANIFIPNATPEAAHSFVKFQKESTTSEMAASLLGLTYSFDVEELLPKVNIPTLVLHRIEDKTIPIQHGRKLAQEISGAQFRVLKGKLHFPWLGDSSEIFEAIFGFHGKDELIAPLDEKQSITREGSEEFEQASIVFTDFPRS